MKITLRPRLWAVLSIILLTSLGLSVAIWTFLRGQEERRAKSLLASASGSLQDRVQAELDQELSAIQLLASKWTIRRDMPRSEWEYDVRHILEQHPSLLSVAWIENPRSASLKDWNVTWSLPTIYDPAVSKIHSLVQDSSPQILTTVIQERKLRITDALLVADRGKAFAVYIPAVVDGEVKGVILGLFHLQVLMDFVFDRLLATDYSIRLMDGYDAIYQRGESKSNTDDWEYQGSLKVLSASYRLRLWPSPEVQRANHRLADLILMVGAAGSVLLTALLYFALPRPNDKHLSHPRQVSENFQELEKRLRVWEAALSSLDEPLFVAEVEAIDSHGPQVLFANHALSDLTGYEAFELIGKSPNEILGDDFLTPNESPNRIISICNKHGIRLDVEMRINTVRDPKLNVTHWIVSLTKPTVPSTQDADSLLQKIISDTPLPVQIFDFTGNITHWNSHAETITGYNAAEMIGKSTPLGVQFPTPMFWTRQDLRLCHKNGNRLDLAVWTAPLRNLDGARSTRFISLMADLTSEHMEQEKLAERETSFKALVDRASDILAILDDGHNIQYANPAMQATSPENIKQKLIEPIPGTHLLMLSGRSVEVPPSSITVLEEMRDAVLTYDNEHRITWMNHSAEQLYGFKAGDAIGKTLSEVQPDWLQMPSREKVFSEFDAQGFWQGEISNFTPTGREIVHHVSISNTSAGIVAIHRDITASKSAVEALDLEENSRTRNVMKSSEGLWDWNIRTGEVYYSPHWKQMLGYADHEITGELDEWYLLTHPDDAATLRNSIASYLNGHCNHLEVEYRIRSRDGQYRWMLSRAMAVRDSSGIALRLVGLQTDIHNKKQQEEQILFEAFHDPLTGLPNRALFLDHLNGELSQPSRPIAVAFFDLKHFAAINDHLGARGGDKALAEVGQRIASCLPFQSFTARLGSDEFAALLHETNEANLDSLLALVRSRLATPFEFASKQVTFELRCGYVTTLDRHFTSAESMLQAASRSIVEGQPSSLQPHSSFIFNPDQFRVFYHPIVSLESGEIFGMEALVRWQHPERGLLTPAEFLPAAEASGEILAMDRWVLREACSKAHELNRRFPHLQPLILTVNLSAAHFRTQEACIALEQLIHSCGISTSMLRLEINPTANLESLNSLDLDLDLAGAMEAGSVKLPPALVRNLASTRSFEQAEEIIREARKHNLKVIAEGVESLEQLAILRELKCHLAQGFYFTKPASGQDTERLLARSPRW